MLYQNISKYFFIPLSTKCNDELRENNFWSKRYFRKRYQIPSCFITSSKRTSRNRSPRRATLRLRRHHRKQVNNALARVNNLTQSILAKAFRGELTAQWRAENPDLISGENSAAALLEKIKAERAASGVKKPHVKILNIIFWRTFPVRFLLFHANHNPHKYI